MELGMVEIGDPYTHRHNSDGTFDSICMSCFQTVGHEIRECDLAAAEAIHKCVVKLIELRPAKKSPKPERSSSPIRNSISH
jgi:hypothetical protein